MDNPLTRRKFLKTSGAVLAAPAILSSKSPNSRVRLASVGVGGKGWVDLNGAAYTCEVAALCDINHSGTSRKGGMSGAREEWAKANVYADWREMLEKEKGKIDAITVSTPDHMHAPVTMTALKMGIATYTQKPLTRTVAEARAITKAAAKAGVSTQMGNQHHSASNYRALHHIVQSGALGKIKVAHTWSNRPVWPQGIDRPKGSDPIPKGFNWDLWLGVAPERPYKKDIYAPFKWRGWYDFGAGALGDMGCHIIDPVVWSLELGPAKSVQYAGPKPKPETFPANEVLTYRFPGTRFTAGQEITMTWSDGGKKPSPAGSHLPKGLKLPSQGVLLIGEEGTLLTPHGGKLPSLYPLEKFKDYKMPELPRWNHYDIWVDGVKTGKAPNSNFSYAGPLCETVLLGVIASRVPNKELLWNPNELKFSNSEKANSYIREDYRKGWEVEGLG